jgi:hypothetical protein
MFTSASDVLKQSRRDQGGASSSSKRRQSQKETDASTKTLTDAAQREAAKRARIARGEDKKASSKGKPKQSSIYDAFGAAMAKASSSVSNDGGGQRKAGKGKPASSVGRRELF